MHVLANRPLIPALAICIFSYCAAAGHLTSAAPPEPDGERHIYKQVQDSSGDTRALHIFVTKPSDWQDNDTRPAIVFFHGGSWVGGAPGQFTEHAKYFASRGLVCFQVEYRLLDRDSSDPPITCTQDAVDALRWVRSNASRFGLDPTRIASAGGSAGGHLAAYVGCIRIEESPETLPEQPATPESGAPNVDYKPNAMILFNPVYDNGPDGWGTARVGDRYPEFSPLHSLSEDDPPSIVFLGSADKLVPVATAEKFRDTSQQLGIHSELHVYEGQPHGFFNFGKSNGKFYYQTVSATDSFLQQLGWLNGPATLEPPSKT